MLYVTFRPDPCSQCECTAVGLECRRYVCPVDCPGGYYRPQVSETISNME